MAQISLTIPDAVMPRVVDALCAQSGDEGPWTAESGLTRGQWAKREVVRYVRRVVIDYEARLARDEAGATAAAQADADMQIT